MKHLDLASLWATTPLTDPSALYSIGYGLYAVCCREQGKDNALIVNTVAQISSSPTLIAVGINRANHSRGIILRTKRLNVCPLTESAPFSLFQRLGFQSGKNTDKMAGLCYGRSENNLPYLLQHSNSYLYLKVEGVVELPSHTLFLCSEEESAVISKEPTMSYAYYHAKVKPKKKAEKKGSYVCKICGYVYEGESLPADFICPICKHPASDFEKQE
jgi:flavin reductase (DIM6/NTAB) family NADH-FMN oxidoreductase RutF